MMKFLIAGFGSIGRRHFRNLKALGQEDFIFLRSHRSTLPDDEIAAYPVETDIQAALAHRPQAVIVANPTALHLDVAIPAAEQGCHLFLEKPISHSLERLDQLEAAAARGGGKILVGFQFRFHPGLQRIAALLAAEAIGRPLACRAHWGEYLPSWHPWEDYRQSYAARAELGGGVTLTLCHPLDYLRWLLGDVAALWALCGKLSDLEMAVEDSAEIGLRFCRGVIGSVHLNYVQRPPQHTLEIVGTRGTLRWDNADGVVRISRLGEDDQPAAWETYAPPDGFARNVMFLEQMRHFLAVCRGENEPLCTLQDGIAALRLALAALASSERAAIIRFPCAADAHG